ncbi:MAG TPA: deoxyribonuclease IV [Syntrophorhabdaceae bacterium]|nr:deoxyribonuclease IV [Syntrophorhabdaceae bacterium]HQM80341.1 deoxyribonuclease IV [Syntrophorhabdaceae bacterium]
MMRREAAVKIGFHISIACGFDKAHEEAKRLRCDVVQIFVKNPRSWAEKLWRDEDVEAFRKLSSHIPVFAHLSYLPNLAKIDEDERNMKGFAHEAGLCRQLGIPSIVVHCGSREKKEKGIAMAARAVNEVLARFDIQVLLENASGQGASLGRNIPELTKIYEQIERKEKAFLCLDTAHLFQSGYDIRQKKVWNGLIGEIGETIGKEKVAFFHLNDSSTGAGSRVDRHWHIGKGELGIEFFRLLLSDKRFAHLAGVMETPKMGKMDIRNMKVMRSLLSPLMSRSSS